LKWLNETSNVSFEVVKNDFKDSFVQWEKWLNVSFGGIFEVLTAGLYLSPVLVLRAHNDYSKRHSELRFNRS